MERTKHEVTDVKLTDLAEHADLLQGKRVSTEGIVAFPKGVGPNEFVVFRFLIWCCTSEPQPFPFASSTSGQ